MVFNKRVLISLVFKYELPGFRQWTFTLGCDTAAIASKKIQTTSVGFEHVVLCLSRMKAAWF